MNVFKETLGLPEPGEPWEGGVPAGCGHEVYPGEALYFWEGGTLCPDCLEDKLRALPLPELAALLGVEFTEIQEGR